MFTFSDSDCFKKLNLDLKAETEISPTLREILAMFDDPYRAASEMEEAMKNTEMNVEDYEDNEHSSFADDGGMGEVIDEFEADQSEEVNASESVEEVSHDNTSWDYNGEIYDEDVGQEGGENYDQVRNFPYFLTTSITILGFFMIEIVVHFSFFNLLGKLL